MNWIIEALRNHLELALFLSLALGYGLGSVRIGSFQLGGVLGTLLAALVVGQAGISVPDAMKTTFFLLFLFAIGFRTGPEFFRGLRANAIPQVALTALLCTTALGVTLGVGALFNFDAGTTAGLLAGSMTNSATVGTATDAVRTLGLAGDSARTLSSNVAMAYAVTYLFGLMLVIWLLPRFGPMLMRVDLAASCRELEQELGLVTSEAGVTSTYHEILVRTYRLPKSLAGRTVAEAEALWPEGFRVVIVRVRRGTQILDATPAMRLQAGDAVALGGRHEVLVGDANPLAAYEIQDRELLDIPSVSADIVLTSKALAGKTMEFIAGEVAARCIFVLKIRRGGQDLPFARHTVVERGDVLSVAGLRPEIQRVADELGFVEWPTTATDMLLVAGAIFIGGTLGLPALHLGRLDISLSVAVGALLGGLVLGQLRAVNPRFGRIPDASLALFESLGLAAFLALVGLGTGTAVVAGLRESGAALLLAAVIVTVVPHVITILVGRYLVKMHPGILLGLCAGAGTSAPALAALQEKAQSKIPTLGYGMACAVGNVLMAFWGTVTIILLGG
jgi:putative transport protein